MQVTIDRAAYDARQLSLTREIARAARDALRDTGLAPERLEKAVQNLTFRITAILDGSGDLDFEEDVAIPVVMFTNQDDEVTEVVSSGGTSFMHEYAMSVASDVLGERSERDRLGDVEPPPNDR